MFLMTLQNCKSIDTWNCTSKTFNKNNVNRTNEKEDRFSVCGIGLQ